MVANKGGGVDGFSSCIQCAILIDPFLKIRQRLRAMDNVLEDIVIQVRRRFLHVPSFLLLINEGIPRFLATTRRLVLEREGDNLILHNYMELHDERASNTHTTSKS
jgi:hypothetical protein